MSEDDKHRMWSILDLRELSPIGNAGASCVRPVGGSGKGSGAGSNRGFENWRYKERTESQSLATKQHISFTITMSSQKPIFVVLGATGQQGGSVISHFLSLDNNPYALRGVTRDSTSAKAKALTEKGVEMVTANADSPSALDVAFEGASIIFSVTDFWTSYVDPKVREQAAASGKSAMLATRDNEAQQGRNIIDAAAKVPTLERFIMSSLPYFTKLTGGKYVNVTHYDSKGIAEEYGREHQKELWAKASILYVGFYTENYVGDAPTADMLKPVLVCYSLPE